MNKRILLITIVSLVAVLSVLAQEQSPVPPPSQSSPAVDLQGVRNYLLGPGDVLDVRVFSNPDLNTMAEIDGDGNISSLPFLEKPIRAQCLTEREVQKSIATAYATYIRNPQVSVRIAQRNSRPPATIYGAVHSPSVVPMMHIILPGHIDPFHPCSLVNIVGQVGNVGKMPFLVQGERGINGSFYIG